MSLSACPSYSLLEAREKYLLSLKVLIYSLYPFFFSFPLTRAVLFVYISFFFFLLLFFFFFLSCCIFFFFPCSSFLAQEVGRKKSQPRTA